MTSSMTVNLCAATVIDVLWSKNEENDFQGCEQLQLVVKLRLQDAVCLIMFIKNIIFLFSMQNPGMHAFNFTVKEVALACNSCAGWGVGAGNLIAVPAVNSLRTKY